MIVGTCRDVAFSYDTVARKMNWCKRFETAKANRMMRFGEDVALFGGNPLLLLDVETGQELKRIERKELVYCHFITCSENGKYVFSASTAPMDSDATLS